MGCRLVNWSSMCPVCRGPALTAAAQGLSLICGPKVILIMSPVKFLVHLIFVFFHQVKIWFQNRRMKWKRSRKAKEQAAPSSPLTDTERTGADMHHTAKPQSDSHSSSLEDEEEIEGEDEDEKEEIEVLRAGSLGSMGFMRHAGGGTGNYSRYSEEELEEGGPRTRCGVFP